MRKFSTGAIRDDDENKINYEKGLSPIVLQCYGEFMRRHNAQVDGGHRDEGNWKKGFTRQSYMESKWRHFMKTWLLHDEFLFDPGYDKILESLCAEMFNTMGMMHVILLERRKEKDLKVSVVQVLTRIIKACGLKIKDKIQKIQYICQIQKRN